MACLFVLVEGPVYADEHSRLLARATVAAMVSLPVLVIAGLYMLQRAELRARRRLQPESESVALTADESGLCVRSDHMVATYTWDAVLVNVIDEGFAVLLMPRMGAVPVPLAASPSSEDFFAFLRSAQQYKAAL